MKRVYARVKRNPFLLLPVLVVVAGGWFLFGRGAAVQTEILTVARGTFVDKIAVSGSVVAAQDVDLGFAQGGRVAHVYVAVGARVGQRAVLAEVENADLRASILQQQAALQTQQAKLDALTAGTRPEELAVKQNAVANDSTGLIDALQDAYRAADAAVHNTLDQYINNPRTTPSLNFLTIDSTVKTSVENKRLAAEGILNTWNAEVFALTPQNDLAAATAHAAANLAAVTSLLADTNTALNRAIPTTQTSQSTIDGYIAAVATARTNVNAALSAVNTSSAALSASQKDLALSQAGSTPQDIAAQQAQVSAAEASVAQARAQLEKTYIRAPFFGIVSSLDAKVGQIVSPDTPEISMLSVGTFQIESYVPEVAVAKLAVGNPAAVWLDAYGPGVAFDATVISIAPGETVRNGVSNYKTTLQFNVQDSRIRSGMTANLSITTQQKENTIVIPQGALMKRGGKIFVKILSGKEGVEREVTLGLSSVGSVEVLSGLSPGEILLLNP